MEIAHNIIIHYIIIGNAEYQKNIQNNHNYV